MLINCACGCGETLESVDSRGRTRGLIRGHNGATSAETKFWSKVLKIPYPGCWIWTGLLKEWGYGWFRQQRNGKPRIIMAHRFSWELRYGAIPKEMSVLHRCHTPACVNPDHLYLGDHYQNMQDRKSAGHYGGPRNRGNL